MAQKNMSLTKCPMPSLAPDYRNKVFEEVATGYSYEMAIEEARRCLNCKNKPCVAKCPVRIDIPEFIDKLANEDVKQTKEEVYRAAIREIGIFKDFLNLSPDDAKTLRTAWGMLGTGWVTEQVDFSQDGEKVTIRCYYGSARYNTKQMSRLIDNLVEDCKALGIPTETPEQIEQIKSLWAQAPKKG